jgi:hypothetical protein
MNSVASEHSAPGTNRDASLGLTSAEAARRLSEQGRNEICLWRGAPRPWLHWIWSSVLDAERAGYFAADVLPRAPEVEEANQPVNARDSEGGKCVRDDAPVDHQRDRRRQEK